jgi:Bifunctional DNA primase/polymerase, N-terminal
VTRPAELLAHALAYAARGWAVLPLWWPGDGDRRCACPDPTCGSPNPERPDERLGSPAKHPIGELVPHGLQQATTDQRLIERWWFARARANVGLRTGAISGLVVLDVDGPAGEASLRGLVEQHGRFRATWAMTGSGGWHAYFAHPGAEVGNSAGRLGPKLDVRGDGGYVVAPPSRHFSGGDYQWRSPVPPRLLPAPSWMLELLATPPPPAPPRPVRLESGVSAYVVAAVEAEAHEVAVAPAGQRNNRLNLAAWRLGQLVGAGLVSENSVSAVLLAAAAAAGLAERGATATVRSGLAAGARHPRPVDRR